GWFSSYLLLSGMPHDKADRGAADAIYQRLVTGSYQGEVEHLNLERRLVSALAAGCERMVVGYTVKHEYFNGSGYSEGLENIAYDSQAGFKALIFFRAGKLKDFFWDGWVKVWGGGENKSQRESR